MSYQRQIHESQYRSVAPQLRHTCDTCNIAKVKCSKTKPRCARCEARKAECVYSVSLRSIKGTDCNSRHLGYSDFNGDRTDTPKGSLPPTPITPVSLSTSEVSQPVKPLPDAGFNASILDGWTIPFSEVDDQLIFPDFGEADDPTMAPPNGFPENDNGPDQRDHFFSDRSYMHRPPTRDLIRPCQSNSNSPSPTQKCSCRQRILARLSDSWLAGRSSSIPFDKSLSENKTIIALCTSTLECPNPSHTDDITLMLTIIALLTQIITIFDSPHPDWSDTNPCSPDEASTYPSKKSSSTLSNHSNNDQSHLPAAHQRVRLSLGSYQLDQRDEQVLRGNLLRIELGKIVDLVELFERRFGSANDGCDNRRMGGREPKPFAELLTYLRRRLRASHEALRS